MAQRPYVLVVPDDLYEQAVLEFGDSVCDIVRSSKIRLPIFDTPRRGRRSPGRPPVVEARVSLGLEIHAMRQADMRWKDIQDALEKRIGRISRQSLWKYERRALLARERANLTNQHIGAGQHLTLLA